MKIELLGHQLCSDLLNMPNCFPKSFFFVWTPTFSEGSWYFQMLQCYKVIILISCSLSSTKFDNIFLYFWAHLCFLYSKMFVYLFCPFLLDCLSFFFHWCKEVVYQFCILTLFWFYVLQIPFSSLGLLFSFQSLHGVFRKIDLNFNFAFLLWF